MISKSNQIMNLSRIVMLLQTIEIEDFQTYSIKRLMVGGWTAAHLNSTLRLRLVDGLRRRWPYQYLRDKALLLGEHRRCWLQTTLTFSKRLSVIEKSRETTTSFFTIMALSLLESYWIPTSVYLVKPFRAMHFWTLDSSTIHANWSKRWVPATPHRLQPTLDPQMHHSKSSTPSEQ